MATGVMGVNLWIKGLEIQRESKERLDQQVVGVERAITRVKGGNKGPVRQK